MSASSTDDVYGHLYDDVQPPPTVTATTATAAVDSSSSSVYKPMRTHESRKTTTTTITTPYYKKHQNKPYASSRSSRNDHYRSKSQAPSRTRTVTPSTNSSIERYSYERMNSFRSSDDAYQTTEVSSVRNRDDERRSKSHAPERRVSSSSSSSDRSSRSRPRDSDDHRGDRRDRERSKSHARDDDDRRSRSRTRERESDSDRTRISVSSRSSYDNDRERKFTATISSRSSSSSSATTTIVEDVPSQPTTETTGKLVTGKVRVSSVKKEIEIHSTLFYLQVLNDLRSVALGNGARCSIAAMSGFRRIERVEEEELAKQRLNVDEGEDTTIQKEEGEDDAEKTIRDILESEVDDVPLSLSVKETKNERMMKAVREYILYLFPVNEHHLFRSSTPHADWIQLMELLLPWLVRYIPMKDDMFGQEFEKWLKAGALDIAKEEIDTVFFDRYEGGHTPAFLMQRMNVLINQIDKRRRELIAKNNGN